MSFSHCPGQEILQAFTVGDLPQSDLDRIAAHIEGCSRCETALQDLDAHKDELTVGLLALNHAEVGAPVIPERLYAAATEARSAGGGGSEFDSGKNFSRRLADGPVRLGKFELQAELGAGSFGWVFRAHDVELDRTVALKLQRSGQFADDAEAQRFLREARSAAQLQHPGIVALYETGQTDDGVCFLVSEYVEGDTLEQRLQNQSFSPDETARLVADIAEALDYAHKHGVVHRDLKPANVLLAGVRNQESGVSPTAKNPALTPDSRFLTPIPKITDFGLAKRETGDSTMTQEGQIMGTPAYMSPELARGEAHGVDARSDVFSLGVILYEMLTGERPFQGNRRMLLLQVLEDDPRPPRRLNGKIPRDLETICLKALAKSPARRYASAQALADDLRRFLAGESIQARPAGWGERLWRWCRRNPMAAGLMAAVCLGSSVGFWYLSELSQYFVEQTALESVRMQSQAFDYFNALYSENVSRLDPNELGTTSEYAHGVKKILFPASFTIEAGRRMSADESGMQVRLYSPKPFPWRTDGGLRDEFDKKAWRELYDNPDEPVYAFTELQGKPVLRYATARRMEASCIRCHNEHPQTPKQWKEGEVRGVLEIVRPLDRDIARTRSGLQGAFFVTGGSAVLLFGLSVALVFGARFRSRRK